MQAFLSAVGHLESLWDNGMEVRQEFLVQNNRLLCETANQKIICNYVLLIYFT